MKKTSKILTLILLLSFILSIGFISVVKADNYEWLENGGFEDSNGLSLITNGNFESGAIDGSFSIISGATINGVYYYSPIYALSIADNQGVFVNFTSTPISNFNEISCWARSRTSGASGFSITPYYSDGTTGTESDYIETGATYAYFDLKAELTFAEGKEVVAFKLQGEASYGAYVDDVICTILETGQTEITTDSTPWYSVINDCDNQIIHTVSHSGNASLAINAGTYTGQSNFRQNLNYLNTESITSLTCWVSTGNTALYRFSMKAFYSDGSYSILQKSFYSYGVWTLLDFTDVFDNNKLCTQIEFLMSSTSEGLTYFWTDDFSLLATIPQGLDGFTFTVSPSPIKYFENPEDIETYISTEGFGKGFMQRYGVAENVYCKIYDTEGNLTENGNFTVISNSGAGYGSVIDGTFNFSITARTLSLTNSTEVFYIYLSLDARELSLTINAVWVKITSGGGAWIEEGGGIITEEKMNTMLDYIIMFLFMFAPSLIMAYFFTRSGSSAMLGFFSGLCIVTPLGVLTGLIDTWFLFLIIVVMAIQAVVMLNSMRNSNGGA